MACSLILRRAVPACLLVLFCAGIAPAWADDPTRPPAVGAAGDATPDEGAPQLQSVFLPQGGGRRVRPAALINGQRVEVGQRWGEWRLLAVSESGATLAGPSGRQTLSLTPGVAKTPHLPARAPTHRVSGHARPAPAHSMTGNR